MTIPSRAIHRLMICSVFLFILSACQSKQDNAKDVSPDPKSNTELVTTSKETKNDSAEKQKYILFFGNSLTAGYGLDEQHSFPSLIQNRIDSLNLPYTVINAGLSGETTAGGDRRIDWVLKQQIDLFVLELGPNDFLRGLDLKATEENLRSILNKVRTKYSDIPIILAGMQAPPNLGQDYANTFGQIYPKLSKEFDAGLIPFLLEDVASIPDLNLPDGMHPNEAGQRIVMENVWKVLEDYL